MSTKPILSSILALAFTLTVTATALAKTAYVDMAKVVDNYDQTKEARAQLEREFEGIKAELATQQQELAEREKNLYIKKTSLAKAEYARQEEKLASDQQLFQEKYRQTLDDLKKREKEETEKLVAGIRKVVAQVALAGKYDQVFDKGSMLFGGDDITYQVLDALSQLPADAPNPESK